MNAVRKLSVKGVLQHLIYSPKGEIEGALVKSDQGDLQLVVGKGDDMVGPILQGAEPGQEIKAHVAPATPSKKGAQQPVHDVLGVMEIDGRQPARLQEASGAAYRGKVARLNFARHGEPNGVVLDSGDFIHLKPDGMARMGLQIGDVVNADGDAQRLVDDKGWAVEATHVNGVPVKGH